MENNGGFRENMNQDTSWVFLEHGERFSPTQYLALPFDENSSSSSRESFENMAVFQKANLDRVRARRHSISNFKTNLTPARSIFNEFNLITTRLTPALGLDFPRGLEVENMIAFRGQRSGSRLSRKSSDSIVEEMDKTDAEVQRLCQTRARATSDDLGSPQSNEANLRLEQLVQSLRNQQDIGAKDDSSSDDTENARSVLGVLNQIKKEKLQRQKERKRLMSQHMFVNKLEIDTAEPKKGVQNRSFLEALRCHSLPFTFTHVLAVLVGVYIGRSMVNNVTVGLPK